MEKIKKFTLYVGLNDKDTKKQEIADEAALVLIKNEVARRPACGAFEITNTT